MKFTVDKQEKYVVFTIEEEKLTSLLAPKVKSEMVMLNQEGVRNIILDMRQVKYVDSSGLSAILTTERLCKNSKGSFVLCGVQELVRRSFRSRVAGPGVFSR